DEPDAKRPGKCAFERPGTVPFVMEPTRDRAFSSAAVVLPLAALLLHLLCAANYGYFRDELYYLACAHRMAWGYVHHPPFCVALLKGVTSLFGEGLFVVRAPMAVASALTVWLVVDSARLVGARGWGLWLAGLCPLLSGMYLVVFSFYSMNGLEILV